MNNKVANSFKIVYKLVKNTYSEVFTTFFENDMDVISSEAKRILSDKEGREAYADAISELRRREKDGSELKATIHLKGKKTIELTR